MHTQIVAMAKKVELPQQEATYPMTGTTKVSYQGVVPPPKNTYRPQGPEFMALQLQCNRMIQGHNKLLYGRLERQTPQCFV